MKPSLRLFFVLFALAVLPASAFAFRPAPEDQLARAVQGRALRVGDRGEPVARLQGLLKERGFEPGPLDGIFGPLTLAAVRAAQAFYQLEMDGLAGRLTVEALHSDAGERAAGAPPAADPAGLMIYQAADAEVLPAASPAGEPGEELALTFHGLPDEAALASILTALEHRGMTATFFVSGEAAEGRPDLVKRIHEAGHEVGSLGYAELDMRRVSPMTARALLRRTQRAIAGATGVEPTFFRPPLGRFDQSLTRLVEEEGLRLVLWSNVSVRPVPEMEPQRLVEQLAEALFPRAVLMLPLDRPNAREAVEPLLERLRAGGYRSRTLSDLLERSVARQQSPG